MKSAIDEFKERCNNLKIQLKIMNLSERILSIRAIATTDDVIKQTILEEYSNLDITRDIILEEYSSLSTQQTRSTRSQFIYNIAIISLYGAFEQFIENQIKSYVRTITKEVKKYSLLPKKLQDMHCQLTLKFAQKNLEDKYLDISDKQSAHKKLIGSLYESIIDSENFTICEQVFSEHSANFRFDLITDLFSNAGIDRIIDKTLSINSLSSYYRVYFGLDETANHNEVISKIRTEILDLVLRRNRVAHGEIEDEIITLDYLIEKCDFFSNLCEGIYTITKKTFTTNVARMEIERNKYFNLSKPSKTFATPLVFGFQIHNLHQDNTGHIVHVNQQIYLEGNDFIECHKIESIVFNNEGCELFETEDTFDCGLKLIGIQNVSEYKNHKFWFCK